MKLLTRLILLGLISIQATGCDYLVTGYLIYQGTRKPNSKANDAAAVVEENQQANQEVDEVLNSPTPIVRDEDDAPLYEIELSALQLEFQVCTGLESSDIAFIVDDDSVTEFCDSINSIDFLAGLKNDEYSIDFD